jgi:cation transport ATPase
MYRAVGDGWQSTLRKIRRRDSCAAKPLSRWRAIRGVPRRTRRPPVYWTVGNCQWAVDVETTPIPLPREYNVISTNSYTEPSASHAEHNPSGAQPHGPKPMMMHGSYTKFAAMIATSVFIMFFLMYQLVYEADHLTFSVNRLVAAFVMGAVMTVVMLAFMWSMYEGKSTKIAILVVAALAGAVLISVNRAQSLIDDTRFMTSIRL